MRTLQRLLDQAVPIGFMLMAFGLAIHMASCSINKEVNCPAIPDEENLKRDVMNAIDKEFSK